MVKICDLAELPAGSMKGLQLDDGRRILVVNLDGEIHALDGTCTHEEADLSTGFLLGDRVLCPLHLSQFDLHTGEAVNPPATVPLKKYSVKIENNEVYVETD
jgi:nitrite reductase/ring-hydroxylating ferredoxin subunit